VPAGLADSHVIPPHDQHDADPVVLAAITAVRPIKLAAVMVPIIERDDPIDTLWICTHLTLTE
jgi:hypothetical protein